MRKIWLAAAVGTQLFGAGAATAADVVIGVPNWPSVQVTSNILKTVIEDNLGLEVALQTGTNPIIFEGMDKGSMHVHPEVWLPNQQNLADTFVNQKGSVVQADYAITGTQGMCVPKFVADEHGVTSILDLTDPDKAALFDGDGDGKGEIWIGATGWASTNVEHVRAKSYGYVETLELVELDETLALASLDNAVASETPWVGFCYSPHHVFALHELVQLEEPAHDPEGWNVLQPTDDPDWLAKSEAGSAWEDAALKIHYAATLETDQPEVAAILRNYDLGNEDLSAFTYAVVVDKQDPAAFARSWADENGDRVLTWLGQ